MWIDGHKPCIPALEGRRLPYTVMKSGEPCTARDHLNNANAFNRHISDQIGGTRNASSIYINRYLSPWRHVHDSRNMARQQMQPSLMSQLNKGQHYFYVRVLQKKDIFSDKHVMAKRRNKTSYFKARYFQKANPLGLEGVLFELLGEIRMPGRPG